MRRPTTNPLPFRDHRNQYDIFNNLYIRKSSADLPWAILIETRRFFFFFFCLLVIINEGEKTVSVLWLLRWRAGISLIIFIFEEKNIWANIWNLTRPVQLILFQQLILKLLRMQYLFRERRFLGFLFFFYYREKWKFYVILSSMTMIKESYISDRVELFNFNCLISNEIDNICL